MHMPEEWKTYCQEAVVDGEGPPGEMGRVNGLCISAVESVLYKRRFFSMAEGHIGLGPEGTESGKSTVSGLAIVKHKASLR